MTAPMPVIERRILKCLANLHYLSNSQLTRLLVAPTSGSYIRSHLTRLETAGLIRHDFRQLRKTNYGPTEFYYYLTVKAMQWLRHEGVVVPIRTPLSNRRTLFQEHMILVNNTIIAGCEWHRQHPDRVTVERIEHDAVLKRDPIRVALDGETVRYGPDAFVTFAIADERPLNVLVECDRGTEQETQWRRKVATILAGWRGPIRERFGTDRFTVLVVVNTGGGMQRDIDRAGHLLLWTRAELAKRRLDAWGRNLLFTVIDPGTTSGTAFFTEPICVDTRGEKTAIL